MNTRLVLPFVVFALSGCTALTPSYPDLALNDLFNNERVFARMATARGTGAALNQYMAADAVVFRPGPATYLRAAPGAAGPSPAAPVLEWAPQAGAVARSNDLGFTTGPYRVVKAGERLPLDQGYFFSIWKRVDGAWRVAVDAGVSTTGPAPQEGLANFLTPIGAEPATPTALQLTASHDELLARERAPRSLAVLPPEGTPSYYDWVTTTTRWLRPGPAATFGTLIRDELSASGGRVEWAPIDVTVSQGNDFAYSYGALTRTTGDGRVYPGWYVHVWQRTDLREWKLAVAVWLPPS